MSNTTQRPWITKVRLRRKKKKTLLSSFLQVCVLPVARFPSCVPGAPLTWPCWVSPMLVPGEAGPLTPYHHRAFSGHASPPTLPCITQEYPWCAVWSSQTLPYFTAQDLTHLQAQECLQWPSLLHFLIPEIILL